MDQIRKGAAPVYLFFGPESYQRAECRRALVEAWLEPEDREAGFTLHDLEETSIAAVLDDARSFSLFSPRRVIWVTRAEGALPRTRSSDAETAAKPAAKDGSEALLAEYLRDPTPGVVIVFDSSRFELDGDDNQKAERVRRFFSAIRNVVEFPRWRDADMRRLAQDLVKSHQLKVGHEELAILAEAAGGSPARLAQEIEKLSLFAGPGGKVTAEDLARMVPEAQAATLFELVAALGRGERNRALELLDALLREGEYLPLALQFLSTQFRQAIAAQEAGLRGAGAIQGYFSRQGVMMWPSKAEQIARTMEALPPARMWRAMEHIAAADRALKDIRPDDRLVMEQFVLNFTR